MILYTACMNQYSLSLVHEEERTLISILNEVREESAKTDISSDSIEHHREEIIDLADRHGVLPQLYRYLSKHEIPLSETIETELKQTYRQIASDNLLISAHLVTFAKKLESKGLRYIAIKGPALSCELYGDMLLRQYSDIDLFVDWNEMAEMFDCAVSLGYRPILPRKLLERRKFFELDSDYSFVHRVTGIKLELHWKLFPDRHRMPFSFSELYGRSKKVMIQNADIVTLSPEDNLLYLTLHGAKHIFERFVWVCDIDRLIRKYPTLDMEEIYREAVEIRSEEAFLLGIHLAHNLFRTPLPHTLLELYSEETERLVGKTIDYYNERFLFWKEEEKKYARFLFLADLHRSHYSKAISFLVSLFRPTAVDVIEFGLPDRWDFLYPILRPYRLLGKYLFGGS